MKPPTHTADSAVYRPNSDAATGALDGAAPTPIAAAVVRAVVYADLFDFPIHIDELWRQLPMHTASMSDVAHAVDEDAFVTQRVQREGDLIFLRGREHLVQHRRQQELDTDELVDQHLDVLRILSRLPWIRMVAFSGGTSRKNSIGHDDIDLFIVTARRRAWAVYALMVVVSRAMGCRDVLCANYLVDVDNVSVPDRGDLFTGHEMMALRPLVGENVLRHVCAKNPWVNEILPNASPRERERLWAEADWEQAARDALEIGLWPAGALLERVSRVVFGPRIRAKARRTAGGDVLLRNGLLKLHTTDNRKRVIARFRAGLEKHGLWSDALGARMPRRHRS